MVQTQVSLPKPSTVLSLKLALLTVFFTLIQPPQVLLAAGIPQRWEARQYQPPVGIGAPSRVEGGGTRGDSCPLVGKPLKALVPRNGFGVTLAAYPSFFVYMPALAPQTPPLPVEFIVEDMDGNEVYKSNFKTNGQAGIVTINLPTQAGVAPLQVGKDYRWSYTVLCQPDERSRVVTVEGLVRRVELNPRLKTQISQASPQRQVDLYAQEEIWQDALATLVQLRRNNPNDSVLAAKWAKLMGAAGLDDLTQESLVPSPTTPRRQLSSQS